MAGTGAAGSQVAGFLPGVEVVRVRNDGDDAVILELDLLRRRETATNSAEESSRRVQQQTAVAVDRSREQRAAAAGSSNQQPASRKAHRDKGELQLQRLHPEVLLHTSANASL